MCCAHANSQGITLNSIVTKRYLLLSNPCPKLNTNRLPNRQTADKMGDKGMSGESESIADKYFVCTECLVEGNVQSFVDLFYLVAIRPSLICVSPCLLRVTTCTCGELTRTNTRTHTHTYTRNHTCARIHIRTHARSRMHTRIHTHSHTLTHHSHTHGHTHPAHTHTTYTTTMHMHRHMRWIAPVGMAGMRRTQACLLRRLKRCNSSSKSSPRQRLPTGTHTTIQSLLPTRKLPSTTNRSTTSKQQFTS